MGSDKICAKKQVSDSGPQDFEGGLPSNVFPSDAMYGGEEEGTSRRADQVIFPLHDCRPTAQALSGPWSAVSKSIATNVKASSEVAKVTDFGTITPSLTPGPPVDEGYNST
jgi:hypothetical protein